jgi:predicted transcriptional regulator YdeE
MWGSKNNKRLMPLLLYQSQIDTLYKKRKYIQSSAMDSYSHGAFQVSGYKVTINNPQEAQSVIQAAWHRFMKEGLSKLVEHKATPHVQAVYYNYTNLGQDNWGYDMLIGFGTEDGSQQTNSEFIDVLIPAQDYHYLRFTSNNFPQDLPVEWAKINSMPKSELNRTYGYDLEMYSEDYKTCTLAVGVNTK